MLMSELIVLRGPIGAGKTSIMQSIARQLPHCAKIEIDCLKRMLDTHESSDWRREIAFNAALYMTQQALVNGRSVVTETHSKRPEQQLQFRQLSDTIPGANYRSVLVRAPFSVCLERSQKRIVPDINYAIDTAMVAAYYGGLEPLPNELVVDTTELSAENAASMIVQTLMTV